jgi:signal transduction histidine kinase
VLYAGGALLFPAFLLSFVRSFTERRDWTPRELLLYVAPAALIWPSADALAHRHATVPWRLGVAVMGLYLLAAIAQSLWDLRQATSTKEAAQLRALSAGLVAGTIPGIVLFVQPVISFGHLTFDLALLPLLILAFLVAISYAVLLFELSDADLVVRRGMVYSGLTLLAGAAYGVLGLILASRGAVVGSPGGGAGFAIVTLLLVATFGSVHRGARRLTDWLLYGKQTRGWEVLRDVSDRLAAVMEPDRLGSTLVTGVVSALHLRGAFLLWRQGEEFAVQTPDRAGVISPAAGHLTAAVIRAALGEPPRPLLLLHARPLTPRRRRSVPQRFRPLDDLRAALFFPLETRSGLQAVLCLQPKLAHDAFSRADLQLLVPLVRQASVALDNALLLERLQDNLHELQEAYARIAREQEVERTRLARELHDGTSQELAAVITLASILERQLGPDHPALPTLDRLVAQTNDTYHGVRRASHNLRPVMLHDLGLVHALTRYVGQVRESTGMAIQCQVEEVGPLPDTVELALFRVAQECLENVRKHSGTSEATLMVRRLDGRVELSVSDTGQGIPENGARGLGLTSMRERVVAVGGTLRIESGPGAGTRVEVAIPM